MGHTMTRRVIVGMKFVGNFGTDQDLSKKHLHEKLEGRQWAHPETDCYVYTDVDGKCAITLEYETEAGDHYFVSNEFVSWLEDMKDKEPDVLNNATIKIKIE